MSEDEKKMEKPDKILKIVEEILDFNKKFQKKLGHGLKIFNPCLHQIKCLVHYQLL